MKRRWLRRTLVGLGLLVGVSVATAAVLVLPRVGALRFLLEMKKGPFEKGKPPSAARLVEDVGATGVERVWLFGAGGSTPRPAIVLVHGVTDDGADDGRLLRLAEATRAAGFVAVVPHLPGLARLDRPAADGERLLRLLRAIAAGRIPTADPTRIGVLAISVGGPLALGAAAEFLAGGGKGLRGVCLVGAPDDLLKVARGWFATPLPPEGASGFEHDQARAAEFARNVLLRGACDVLVPEEDRRIVRSWLDAAWTPTALPEGLSTDAGRVFAGRALRGPGMTQHEVEAILQAARPSLAPLSPAERTDGLAPLAGLALFLLHGVEDPLVPVAEIAPLAVRLRAVARVRTLESRLVGHTSVGSESPWDDILFLDAFFDEVEG